MPLQAQGVDLGAAHSSPKNPPRTSGRPPSDTTNPYPASAAADMDRVNPVYIPRNHKVEEALTAAVEGGDLGPFRALVDVLADPFREQPGAGDYARPAPASFGAYQTFCGT